MSKEGTDNFEIYVADADGGNLRRLTYGEADDLWPSWSPDGSKLAFSRVEDAGEVYLVDPGP